jgi:adiponectin receptor
MTLNPKLQGPNYRLFRASVFVAAGMSGVAPLIHGINVFGIAQMMRKAFLYTLAKDVCLLSGTLFYAVRPPDFHVREGNSNTHDSEDQVS